MLLLLDENVSPTVAEFFRARGHEAHLLREMRLLGAADPVVALAADGLSAIIVTYDRDFKRLVERAPEDNRLQFRRLGRISLNCKPQNAVRRLEALIASIEFEHARIATERDGRLIVEITETTLRIVR